MLAVVKSGAIVGIEGFLIKVEIDVTNGLPAFNIVGLPDTSVRESRERIASAIKNSGYKFPAKRTTINLAPADIKKEGSSFDLPMAIGILVSTKQIVDKNLSDYIILGELSLSGKIRKIKGALSAAILAKKQNLRGIIIPKENYKEAQIVSGIEVHGVSTLKEAAEICSSESVDSNINKETDIYFERLEDTNFDIRDIQGQEFAKRALEIAAAGAHNMIMIGPPGSGKTMLAKRLPGILPFLSMDEALETTKIHSVSGLVSSNNSIIKIRPFRCPHHTISDAALIGGGTYPKPGEISLAHNGVLFLDELPEYKRNVLEVLRQPLEDREVVISRAKQSLRYPANIMFVAAMNPCPCGYSGSSEKECRCTPIQIKKYMGKISGPLWDRIDLHIDVPQLSYEDMSAKKQGETSKIIRERVCKARKIQENRFKEQSFFTNTEMGPTEIDKYCVLDNESKQVLERAVKMFKFSARAYTRILKVARTIADLDNKENIQIAHISEAVQYRMLDREN